MASPGSLPTIPPNCYSNPSYDINIGMVKPGTYNHLRVKSDSPQGYVLDGGHNTNVFLPASQVEKPLSVGERVRVFVYHDNQQRLTATTQQAAASVGECAYLRVVSISKPGAFVDWGLPKDLLVPRGEQQTPMQKGYSYTVVIYVDDQTGRLVGSSKLEKHLTADPFVYRPNQAVDLLIYGRSDLGFKAIINHSHLGQLFEGETFQPLHFGERIQGYIKQVRDDGKIDLSLQLPSQFTRDDLSQKIIDHMQQNAGLSQYTDKSSPDDIYQAFGVSKASFKKALGALYKQRLVEIKAGEVRLATMNSTESDKA